MEKEIDPTVLAVINEKRLSGVKHTPVEVITRMGVYDARTQAAASAWLASGDNVIVTIWAELITVAADGRWFHLESLDTHQRLGGGERSDQQIQRAKDRMQLLKYAMDEEQPVRAALQANRVDIQQVESNKDAKISTRVPDDETWRVTVWNADEKYAILVRGEGGWVPTEADLKAARERGGVPTAQAGIGGAQVPSDEVQAAAMAYLRKYFASYGYTAETITSPHFGYDMEVSDKKGNTLLKLAVKGLGGGVRSFKLNAIEREAAAAGNPWRLAVVSDAISPGAVHKLYNPADFESASGLELDLDA
ncbi:hypothetical protein GN316_18140 [Xylophilus sp. Kf1]|nr:hypothetical protein [Xylophilus sp. Kf1]